MPMKRQTNKSKWWTYSLLIFLCGNAGPNVNLQEKRHPSPPPESIIKRLWPQLDPESSDPPKITGPRKVGSLPSTSPPQSKTEAQVL